MKAQATAIAVEAAEWLVELADGPADCLSAFVAWLKASPRHVEEFLLVSAIWRELEAVDPQRRVAVEELIAEARHSVVEIPGMPVPAVTPAPPAAARTAESAGTGTPHWGRRAAVAGLTLAASLTGVWLINPAVLGGPAIYRTARGEQRVVKLEDGSIAHLNTDSRLAVRYTARGRELALLRGEAMFVVEHDAARPFVVRTNVASVRAVGTQFNVYQRKDGTTVSVVQGVVEVATVAEEPAVLRALLPLAGETATARSAAGSSAGPGVGPAAEANAGVSASTARVAAGEQAIVGHRGRIEQSAASDAVAQAVAWRERRLVFRGDTLLDVAREFNRYNRRPIVIEDTGIGTRKLTGVFDADDPESLLLFLSKDPGLALEERRDEVVIRAAVAAAPNVPVAPAATDVSGTGRGSSIGRR